MSAVEDILNRTQFEETIDDLPFKLRIITASIAAQVIGAKTLGLMRGGSGTKEITPEETRRITEGYLTRCMVSPKFGPESSVELDTISLDDLGEFAEKILAKVFERSGFEGLGNSNLSSVDTVEET